MRLKSVSIRIHADLFTASTFIEMEFCNPTEKEMEGLYRFSLQPGQVITAFQLDLNGRYRDGSIEEKWKAANAYNTIVGKRIDPALLQFESENNYSLRIYPVPAKASRKVTITLQQNLRVNKGSLDYALPFSITDPVDHINIILETDKQNLPIIKSGLLAGQSFSMESDHYLLSFTTKNRRLDQTISFSIPFSIEKNWYCTKTVGQQTFFALWYKPNVPRNYNLQPKTVTVYWDASSSAAARNLNKEINFLKQYISYSNISQLTIIPFNYKVLDTVTFYTVKGFDNRWQNYLRSLEYDGATQLGCIDLSKSGSDIIFLFSDGKNTYGNNLFSVSPTQIYCVHASVMANEQNLQAIVGQSGGRYINLSTTSFSDAIRYTQQAENLLLDIQSASGKTIIDQELPAIRTNQILITGVLYNAKDKLIFRYGNNNSIKATEELEIDSKNDCASSSIDKMPMLLHFRNKIAGRNWYNVLEFGIKEKIVTPQTSYIVLERVEDYIKFNITPPKELEEQVSPFLTKKDIQKKREKLEQQDLFERMNSVVKNYNKRILWWDKNAQPIQLRQFTDVSANTSANKSSDKGFISERFPTNQFTEESAQLNDVVIVGYSTSLRANTTGAITTIRSNEFFGAQSIEQVLAGRIAGVHIQLSPTPDQRAIINIRGGSSLSANGQPLFILDGVPVKGDISQLVNINDIQTIEVLKDPVSAILYGSQASNGAIIVNTKKWSKYSNNYTPHAKYKLKNMEDVEYLLEIKQIPVKEKLAKYEELKVIYGSRPGFYFDMAQHLFESGFRNESFVVLTNAAEVSEGSFAVLRAIGYTLENWKQFDEAIKIYKYLLSVSAEEMRSYSDLATAYYQNGNYQLAVEVLYKAISGGQESNNNYDIAGKEILLNEMNGIIAMHKQSIDLTFINPALLQPLPVDLRIVLDCNLGSIAGNVAITEPGGKQCSLGNPTSNGGKITSENYFGSVSEYEIKNAIKGSYSIKLHHYNVSDSYSNENKIPTFIRITTYKNFGRADQEIFVENVIMDNQSGTIEIGEVRWK